MNKQEDLISRQAAIDVLNDWSEHSMTDAEAWHIRQVIGDIKSMPSAQPEITEKQVSEYCKKRCLVVLDSSLFQRLKSAQQEIIRCKDCKYWRQQTNYQGAPLSFGFCESDDMWRSLYGETYDVSHIDTDDDFYCGHAERRTE